MVTQLLGIIFLVVLLGLTIFGLYYYYYILADEESESDTLINKENLQEESGEILKKKIDSDFDPHVATPLSQVKEHEKEEVFHVTGKDVTYEDAEKVCKQYGAKLANYDQILHAYQHGGEWCNYGWSQDQLALYPTQKETWQKIQNAENPKDRNMCGHYGVNGGKFDKHMKFGVNCYGIRPPRPDPYFEHPDLPKQTVIAPKEEEKEKPIDGLEVIPYNRVRWQRDYVNVNQEQ